ncbi:unnamed protein product [Soboliphyme baturini]|uniref:Carbohydrate sulfotransferase n=1 Tax=Soboliphyme baturini TaxID=241478 RepID=A0A183J148_9BILA|nr:unnamed protein product [Soboliphyme baturini]
MMAQLRRKVVLVVLALFVMSMLYYGTTWPPDADQVQAMHGERSNEIELRDSTPQRHFRSDLFTRKRRLPRVDADSRGRKQQTGARKWKETRSSNSNKHTVTGHQAPVELLVERQQRPRFTIVTALFDIGRGNWSHYGRLYSEYFAFMKNLLNTDVQLFVFTDQSGAKYVREQRASKSDRTHVQVSDLHSLPFYHYKPVIDDIISREENQCKFRCCTVPVTNLT